MVSELVRLLASILIASLLVVTGEVVLWIATGRRPRLDFHSSGSPMRLALFTGFCMLLGLAFWLFAAGVVFGPYRS